MPTATQPTATQPTATQQIRTSPGRLSTSDQLMALGSEINANQYRVVHLAARYCEEHDWFAQGLKSAAYGISKHLGIHSSTAREWIRVGHSLRYLPMIDAAFGSNEISYAKARILTRWADSDNEPLLLELARDCSANRLTTAIAKVLAENDPDDEQRDLRQYQARSVTSYTDGDGMTIIRITLPPAIAKPVLAAVDELVQKIAQTPLNETSDSGAADASADAPRSGTRDNRDDPTSSTLNASADAFDVCESLAAKLSEVRRRWHPTVADDWHFPTIAEQRADAFTVLFSDLDVRLTTEVVIHVRGNGNTFDDGTPITSSAIGRQLDRSMIRLLIHDTQRRPINASSRRRHPTLRQKRVVLETHNHQCVDCQSPHLIELDHNPSYRQTQHTITTELEPRCAPCHRARHRLERQRPASSYATSVVGHSSESEQICSAPG